MTFDLTSIHTWYAISGTLISAMYWPQTWRVIRSRSPLYDISIPTWGMWSLCLFISFIYAAFEIQDTKLSLVNLHGAVFCGIITLTTIFKRKKYCWKNSKKKRRALNSPQKVVSLDRLA